MVSKYSYIAKYSPLCQIDGYAEMVISINKNRTFVQIGMACCYAKMNLLTNKYKTPNLYYFGIYVKCKVRVVFKFCLL